MMKSKANDPLVKTIDKRQDDEPVVAQDALADRELIDAIFGEPSDEEIAEALRQAKADFQAGKYQATLKASDSSAEADEPWRPRSKKEILEDIRLGFMQSLAGDVLSLEEFRDQLKE